jgi:hypothetical protein
VDLKTGHLSTWKLDFGMEFYNTETPDNRVNFILTHLQDGCYQDVCILEPETIDMMFQRQANTPTEDQVVTYGFTEGLRNSQSLIGHSGSIRGSGNRFTVFPENHLGYFFRLTPNRSIRMHVTLFLPSRRAPWMNSFQPVLGISSDNCFLALSQA